MKKLFIIDGNTENGDEFAYIVESEKEPTHDQVDAIIYRDLPDEYEEVGLTNWVCWEADIQELPSEKEIKNMEEAVERAESK